MGFCIAFLFSTNATIQWTPDRDLVVNALCKSSTVQGVLISTDPQLTPGQVSTAPTSTRIEDDVVLFSAASQVNNTGLKLNIFKDQKLFVTAGGAMGFFLFVEEAVS